MNTATAEPTPGFNCRISIFFDLDRNGKRRAYRWASRQFRAFPIGLDAADSLLAQEQADRLPFHPLRGPRG